MIEVDRKVMSVSDQVYALMKTGAPVSPLMLSVRFGIANPSATMSSIRHKHGVKTELERVPMRQLVKDLEGLGVKIAPKYSEEMYGRRWRLV
jgi:hypothetical protein